MSKVKILIIEDELIIAEDMSMMLENLGYKVLGVALDYFEALDVLEQESPDIVLADITLGGEKDGIDLAKIIKEKYNLPFIFVTSHADKGTLDRAKQVKPNGYLVKPFEADDLFTSIEVALFNYSGVEHNSRQIGDTESNLLIKDSIYIKDGHLFVKVKIDELLWLKSDGNYLELHTVSKRHVIRSTLKEFIDKLPTKRFFRVHKSYVVNLEHVAAINNINVIVNDETIPLGRNFRDQLLQHLNTV